VAADGPNASMLTVVPFEFRLRVDSATAMTVFFVLDDLIMTALRVVREAYWSSTRTFLPFTKMATLPFFGPATNHRANDLRLTSNNADAPVMDVE
jgi:hypothetical protein